MFVNGYLAIMGIGRRSKVIDGRREDVKDRFSGPGVSWSQGSLDGSALLAWLFPSCSLAVP